jgi:polyisoprenoid-binding protein YceI
VKTLALVLGVAVATAGAAAADPPPYRVESAQSRAEFTIGDAQVSGRFAQVEGRLNYDSGARAGDIQLDLFASSIDTGWGVRDDFMRGASLFDAARYPRVRFRSTHFEFNADRVVRVDGELTLRGVTRRVSFAIPSIQCGRRPEDRREACTALAEGLIRRREFGMDAWWPLIGDDVKLNIHLTLVRE